MSYINGTSERRFFARLGSVCAVCTILAMPVLAQDAGTEADVSVTEYGTIDLAVQDTDLASVLQMLSIQSQKNIITSKSVSATVTANLYDVTFFEALEAVLRPNGYRYIEEGSFIYIYTQAEFEEIRDANRERDSRIFELDYLSASDASELISPLLSESGQVSNRGDVVQGFKPEIADGGADGYAYNAKLVVNDFVDNLDKVAALLTELDSPPQQVLVEATILQTTLDEANAFGVDFTVLGSLDFTNLTAPLDAVTNLLNGADSESGFQPADNSATAATSNVGQTQSAGGLKVGLIRDDVSVFVRVLDEVTDTTVLARPKVMTLNRQRAEVLVGARVGYLSTTATETTTTQTVEFLDTGIQLIFRPFISPNGMIRMELAPSVSEASLRTVTDANGILVTIPDELTNELTTNVRIRDGETMVLGGLFRESNRIARRQVPLLGDIPILGAAFRGQDDTVDRDEIIFLITPSIVHDEKLWAVGSDALESATEAQVGARANLLPFSRSQITGNYNKDAISAYNSGDAEMALYYANNSLRLDPGQPEMINFREMITGSEEAPHVRGLLERAFRKQMGPGQSLQSFTTPQDWSNGTPKPAAAWDNAGQWNGQPSAFEEFEGAATVESTDMTDEAQMSEADSSDNDNARRRAMSNFFETIGIADEADSATTEGQSDSNPE
ncbi:MAG: hypothetical protein AAF432_02610 [Planctomycetota bacterium]